MKVTFILGSPRKEGNVSKILMILSEQLKNAADVETLYLGDYKIGGCLGCAHYCQKNLDELGCIQQDDVDLLLHKLIESDIIFYGTPLYGHSYSGQLKLFMDRHVALFKFISGSDKSVSEMEIKSFIAKKPIGLIVSCQGPEVDNTELIKAQFDKFCESSLAHCVGKYVFPYCDSTAEQSIYSEEVIKKIITCIKELLR